MLIRFCLDDGGEELFSIESNDVAGIIEASKGEKVVLEDEWYKYESHILNRYLATNTQWKQEVVIYLVKY